MKVLVIGLGSMGQRRIRCLKALGDFDVHGFDTNLTRVSDAERVYGIKTVSKVGRCLGDNGFDFIIISTPPDQHLHYATLALELQIDCFIEASVTDRIGLELLYQESLARGVFVLPSCTLMFFDFVCLIGDLLERKGFGEPLIASYCCGQNLNDWHPWENIKDYYVSNRETGGCREIVPFELTWLTKIWGFPVVNTALVGKLSGIDAEIDDFYHCLLSFPDGPVLNLQIDVISKPVATREFRLECDAGIIKYSGDTNCLSYIHEGRGSWEHVDLTSGTKISGSINPEEPYQKELGCFINAISTRDRDKFPNNLEQDCKVLEVLEQIEKVN
jgi:predicted dehydrogenase